MGLVKGAPYEIAPANSNPGRLMRRYWEAHDLIIKALSTTHRPVLLGGRVLSVSRRQHLAATDPAADAADLDDRHERRYRHRRGRTRPRCRHAAVRRPGEADV